MRCIKIDWEEITKLKKAVEVGERNFKFMTPDGFTVIKGKFTQYKGRQTKKVRCVELDIVFNSLMEAAEYFGCTVGGISQSIRTGYKCKGYHFHHWIDREHANKFDEGLKKKREEKIRGSIGE